MEFVTALQAALACVVCVKVGLLNRNDDIVIAAATADGRQTAVSFPMLLTR